MPLVFFLFMRTKWPPSFQLHCLGAVETTSVNPVVGNESSNFETGSQLRKLCHFVTVEDFQTLLVTLK